MHLVSVAFAKALRTYSRSRLEDVCALRGHAGRAEEVAHHDEATELGAEAMAIITGLCLAAGLGAWARGSALDRAGLRVIAVAAAVGIAGSLLAGAIGRVYAERV